MGSLYFEYLKHNIVGNSTMLYNRKKEKTKQIYALLTATVLMATSITGCSGKTTEETAVEETAETEEAPEEEAVEEPVYETRQYTVEVATANEDGTFTAYDTDGK